MIFFTDKTINEAKGNYQNVCSIMSKEAIKGDWMLRSIASVPLGTFAVDYALHFYNNGDIYIHETNRPITLEFPDLDLQELNSWYKRNGWKKLIVRDLLLESLQEYEFWMRAFRAGLISNNLLEKHEKEEMERMQKSLELEKEEDYA